MQGPLRLDAAVAQGWSNEDAVRRWGRLVPLRDESRLANHEEQTRRAFFEGAFPALAALRSRCGAIAGVPPASGVTGAGIGER